MFTIQKTLVTTFILLAIFTTSLSAGYEVRIHVNYPHDVVYAGYLNDVEIWIENSTPLYMIRLPFLYSSNIGAVAWHSPYGTVPASSPYVSIDDEESIGIWELPPGWQVDASQMPAVSSIWGAAMSAEYALPDHQQLTRVLSLKLDATSLAVGDGPFCVDDIFIPPVSRLEFWTGTETFRPSFHECPNCDPLLPAVCFDVVAPNWVKGDANGDGRSNISDCVFLIQYIFHSGEAPSPFQMGDVDCNGDITMSDLVNMVSYIFSGGTEPC